MKYENYTDLNGNSITLPDLNFDDNDIVKELYIQGCGGFNDDGYLVMLKIAINPRQFSIDCNYLNTQLTINSIEVKDDRAKIYLSMSNKRQSTTQAKKCLNIVKRHFKLKRI